MQFITSPINPLDVFALGSATSLVWSHDGFVLAGVGEAARLEISRLTELPALQKTLAAANLSGDTTLPGRGPVAFGALSFDPEAASELVIPQIVAGQDSEGHCWLTYPHTSSKEEALERINAASSQEPQVVSNGDKKNLHVEPAMDPSTWRRDVVQAAIDRIKAGEVEKVVLARQQHVVSAQPLVITSLLERLQQRFPTAVIFAIDQFVGASPEMLVARSQQHVSAHPLAGTTPKHEDAKIDQAGIEMLLKSDKDRWEHQITISWLLDTLLPFCSYVDAEPQPSVVSLANVHHLGTKVAGLLSKPAASILELVAALHPTPALGGNPQAEALKIIDELEGFDRGRYGGPVGWVDWQGNGAFAVGIRSAQISAEKATVCAGVGIVADSDPAAELAETEAKFTAMLDSLQ